MRTCSECNEIIDKQLTSNKIVIVHTVFCKDEVRDVVRNSYFVNPKQEIEIILICEFYTLLVVVLKYYVYIFALPLHLFIHI